MPKSAKTKKASFLSSNKKFSGPTAIIVAVALVIIGIVLIAKSFAYTTTAFPYATPNYPNCPYNSYVNYVGGVRYGFYYHQTVKLGSINQCVVKLQRLINKWRGYTALTPDGNFGSRTLTQVRAFQTKYTPTEVDGIVGKHTWGWLYHVDNCDPSQCPIIAPG